MGLAVAVAIVGCTASDPAARRTEKSAPAERARLDLGLMYWALPTFILGDTHALVFGAVVERTDARPAERPELRGEVIHEATLRVERVLDQRTPADADPARPPPRLRRGDLVITDAADGVNPGDRVLVFATAYEGGYAILPRLGTPTPLGIVVAGWSDPIVAATERLVAGTADLRSELDAAAWRPYGEAAIACALDGVPVASCTADD